MSGSGSGSGEPPGSDAWPQFPDAPNFSDEGFRLSGNILGDFEDLMDLTPNAAPAASFAAHGFGQSASAPAPNTADDLSGSRDSSAVAASAPRTAEERRQFRNRMSQRRFREKQKAKSQSLEAELAQTSAKLQQLQIMQNSLKTKNQLLEKLVQLNKHADMRSIPEMPQATPVRLTVFDLYKQRGFKYAPEPILKAVERQPAIGLTIWETGEQLIPVEDIGKLNIKDFSRFYVAYIHQMAACLAELTDERLSEESHSPAMQRLYQLISESSSLILITCLSNPSQFKDLQNCDFSEGLVRHDALPPSFYSNVAAHMQYTDAQMQDLMYLRHLFYYKMGQLARQRQVLLQNMTMAPRVTMSHASDKLSKVTSWSDQLRENGAEEYRCYMQFVTAAYRGITTTKQLGTGMVCAFPWMPAINKLVEAEAVRQGEPPMQAFIEDTSVSDLQHAADWADVEHYLRGITEENMNIHLPLLQHGHR